MADTNLKIKVEAGKDVFYVYDKTGAYSSQNTGGWGLPNDLISSVQSAVFRITFPEETGYKTADVFPSLPNSQGVGFELIPEDLSVATFPPGVYTFQYYITLPGKVLSQTCYFFHYQPLECCVSKKKSKLSLTDASSDEAKNVVEMETLLENAIWAACSGDLKAAREISELIWTKCGCCC